MGGQDDNLFLCEIGYQIAEAHALFRVKPGGGLIQYENVRGIQLCLGDAQTLLHAAGEGFDLPVCHAAQIDQFQQFLRAGFRLFSAKPLNRRHI